MPKPAHITIAEHLTEDSVAEHVATGKTFRLYDLNCVGLSLRGPNKLAQHVWWFESDSRGTPALGALHKIDLAEARHKATAFGKPSSKVTRSIEKAAKRQRIVSGNATTPPALPNVEALNALVSEMVEARWQAMRMKIADYIKAEVVREVERRIGKRA